MSDYTEHVEVDPKLRALFSRLEPSRVMSSVARGLRLGVEIAVGRLTERRLTGRGPFPVTQNKLGVVTGRLRQSVRQGVSPPRIVGETAEVSVGSRVKYARAHEFGFRGNVNVASHTRRAHMRGGKQVRVSQVTGHIRRVNIPERAPIRTGLRENLGRITESIRSAVTADLNT